jgi:uncharacterized protein
MPANDTSSKPRQSRWPAAGYVMVGVPAIAVIASFVTLGLAMHERDTTFPATFNWEGEPFDRDVERTTRAQTLNVRANLDIAGENGRCGGTLAMAGALPDRVHLHLTHATQSKLDQSLVLQRQGDRYVGDCVAPADGHWYVTLSDAAETWRVRREFDGALGVVTLQIDP